MKQENSALLLGGVSNIDPAYSAPVKNYDKIMLVVLPCYIFECL